MDEFPKLEVGIQVVALPLLAIDHWGDPAPMSLTKTIKRRNAFFKDIAAQGGTILGTYTEEIQLPEQPGIIGTPVGVRTFIIVEKADN